MNVAIHFAFYLLTTSSSGTDLKSIEIIFFVLNWRVAIGSSNIRLILDSLSMERAHASSMLYRCTKTFKCQLFSCFQVMLGWHLRIKPRT